MSETKHFCNECKYYRPVGTTNGLCNCGSSAANLFIHHFYDKSCSYGFEPNLFYWYEVESPEYMELYERNIEIRIKLRLEINAYKYAQKLSEEIDKELVANLVANKKNALIPWSSKIDVSVSREISLHY